MRKIYIIGPVGFGKTTLAKKLSEKNNIKDFELDKVVFDDDNGNRKRNKKEILVLFNKIISKKEWIIEDVGREIFKEARYKADAIYYLKIGVIRSCYKVIKRWINQKIGLEEYNYKPTLEGLIQMLKWVTKDIKSRNQDIGKLKTENKNVRVLNFKDIKDMINK